MFRASLALFHIVRFCLASLLLLVSFSGKLSLLFRISELFIGLCGQRGVVLSMSVSVCVCALLRMDVCHCARQDGLGSAPWSLVQVLFCLPRLLPSTPLGRSLEGGTPEHLLAYLIIRLLLNKGGSKIYLVDWF